MPVVLAKWACCCCCCVNDDDDDSVEDADEAAAPDVSFTAPLTATLRFLNVASSDAVLVPTANDDDSDDSVAAADDDDNVDIGGSIMLKLSMLFSITLENIGGNHDFSDDSGER